MSSDKKTASGCLVFFGVMIFGPWLVSLACIPLTDNMAGVIAWFNTHSPWPRASSPYFTFTAMFLVVTLLTFPLRLTHLEGRWFVKRRHLLTPLIDMTCLVLFVRAADGAQVGWRAADLNLFYSSAGVFGKLIISLLIPHVQLVACGLVMWAAARCFLAVKGVYIAPPGSILSRRAEGPWHDRLRLHRDFFHSGITLVSFMFVYVPSLVFLSIVFRASEFMLTVLVCLMVCRILSCGFFRFISAWLDSRSDRYARELCEELTDPKRAGSRLNAIRRIASLNEGVVSGEPQITAMLEDTDSEVRRNAKAALAKIGETKVHRAESFVQAGKGLMEKGQNLQAVKVYSRAIELNPANAKTFFLRGLAHEARSEHDLAIADYTEAIRLDPKQSRFYRHRGVNRFANEDCDQAVADFDEALRLDPDDLDVRVLRCETHEARGDDKQALADARACRKLGGRVSSELLAKLRQDPGTNG